MILNLELVLVVFRGPAGKHGGERVNDDDDAILYTWRDPSLTIHFDLTFSQGTVPAAPHDASGLGLRPVIVCRRHQHLVTCTQSVRHTVYVQS